MHTYTRYTQNTTLTSKRHQTANPAALGEEATRRLGGATVTVTGGLPGAGQQNTLLTPGTATATRLGEKVYVGEGTHKCIFESKLKLNFSQGAKLLYI